MQTAAGHTVSHIAAELAIGRTRVNIGAACPVTERIDRRAGIHLPQSFGRNIGLADDEVIAVQNVLSIKWINAVKLLGNVGELLLLFGERCTFEDAVVTAADAVLLIAEEMLVLGILFVVHTHISRDAVNSVPNLPAVQPDGRFGDDMASAVTDEDFDRNGGVLFLSVCHVHKGTGDTVSHAKKDLPSPDITGITGVGGFM